MFIGRHVLYYIIVRMACIKKCNKNEVCSFLIYFTEFQYIIKYSYN